MGEHKFPKKLDESNGDEGPKLSTHIVVCVDCILPLDRSLLASMIEAAYLEAAERAKAEDSFILNVVQSVNPFSVVDDGVLFSRLLVTITAQRISRAELEQQQLRQRMGIK